MLTLLALAIIVAAGAAIAVTDPFAKAPTSSNGVRDNAYPTALATVRERSLSSQTQVNATLGYAGTYNITIPAGTDAAVIRSDQTQVQDAENRVATDKQALARAKKLATVTNAATLASAESAVRSASTTLSAAQALLATDERLGCPGASSTTVDGSSTPSGNPSSGNPSSGNPSSGNPSSGSPGAAGTPTTTTTPSGATNPGGSTPGATGGPQSHLRRAQVTEPPPTVSTGSGSATGTSSATVSGTVNPNGAETSYSFEYGPTPALGASTTAKSAGSGTSPVQVSATLSGLRPNTVYEFALVATSAGGTVVGTTGTFSTAQSSCAAERQVVASDIESLASAKSTVAVDRANAGSSAVQERTTLTSDEQSLALAQKTLQTDEAQAANPNTTFTGLPTSGDRIRRGQAAYHLNGVPVPLFYGTVTPDRALALGVSDGPDVTQLQANLIALGFGAGISTNTQFTAATEADVRAWQAAIGAPVTGVVAIGDVVVEPGPLEVDTVSASLGATASPGSAVLSATSTTPVVEIALDASQQSEVKVGDAVTVTLPDNATTPGVVSFVGKVATAPASGNGPGGPSGNGSGATVTVDVTLTHPGVAAGLDQAPVEVAITTQTVSRALVVPVDALLALSSGGYALEVRDPDGIHHLVGVKLGIFDDADGLVQVSGTGVQPGERVVVPAP